MIVIPRGLARSFRTAARRCRPERGSPLPPVLVEVEDGRLTLRCSLDEVFLSLSVVAESSTNESMGLPINVLDAVQGSAVELHAAAVTGTARWSGRNGAESLVFALEAIERDTFRNLRECPLQAMSPRLLTALDECRRIAGECTGRYAFHRLEVNGRAGTLIATDGKQAVMHQALAWPFAETLLIPARSVFGLPDILRQQDVQVGRTMTHLVIAAGPWTIALALDTVGRFPDVPSVVPRSRSATRLELDAEEAANLMAALREWPESGEPTNFVTLDATESLIVQARGEEGHPPHELSLRTVKRDGPPVCVAVDREHLARALLLDGLRWRLIPGKPFLAEADSCTFVAMTLADEILAPTPSPTQPSPAPVPVPSLEERSSDLMKPEVKRLPAPVETSPVPLDPLAEAEAFCLALSEAATRLTRLLQCLQSMKRPRGTLETAFASLSALGFGSGGKS